MVRVTFIHADGENRTEAEAEPGTRLLELAQTHLLPLEGTCEGQMACSTCHIIVSKHDFDRLPRASEMEEDMLDLAAGARRTSRLACQIVLEDALDGLTVHIPGKAAICRGGEASESGGLAMRFVFLVLFLSLAGCGAPAPQSPPPVAFARLSPEPVEHGERLSLILGCSGCHGENLVGKDWSEEGYGRLWTANLTVSAAGYTDAQLKNVITSAKKPDGTPLWDMPSHLFTQLADADLDALISFIRSRPKSGAAHPPPTFGPILKAEMAKGEYFSSAVRVEREGKKWPPDAGPDHRLARYSVRATCAECHGMDLRGSKRGAITGDVPDLRIAGSYDPKNFARLLRTGVLMGERKLGLMAEVAKSRYSHFTDAEIGAIHAYLRAAAERDP